MKIFPYVCVSVSHWHINPFRSIEAYRKNAVALVPCKNRGAAMQDADEGGGRASRCRSSQN